MTGQATLPPRNINIDNINTEITQKKSTHIFPTPLSPVKKRKLEEKEKKKKEKEIFQHLSESTITTANMFRQTKQTLVPKQSPKSSAEEIMRFIRERLKDKTNLLKIHINGLTSFMMKIDNGADLSLIPRAFVDQHNIATEKLEVPIAVSFNGIPGPVYVPKLVSSM